MKFVKLIKAEEVTEEQAQQYYSKTIEDEEARKLFLEARQKAIEICSKYGYEPRCSYGGSKEHPMDEIYADGPYNSYKPDIRVVIYSPWDDGREGGRIQTTTYGSIPTNEYEEFLQSCQKAFACVKELEKEFIK